MKVTIKAFGVLRNYISPPHGELEIELDAPKTLAEILAPYNIAPGLIMMVSVGGVQRSLSYKPQDGDEIRLVPPISGGSETTNTRVPGQRSADEKVTTWPHLLIIELIATLIVLILLLLVSILIDAPLAGAADPTVTPSSIKAPWCFVGLQELLVYFDPWLAGAGLPFFLFFALVSLPYLDYRAEEGRPIPHRRRFAIFSFSTLLILWFALIFIGSYLRGPGWRLTWPGGDISVIGALAATSEQEAVPPARALIDISTEKPSGGREIVSLLSLRLFEKGPAPFIAGLFISIALAFGVPIVFTALLRKRFGLTTGGAFVRGCILAFYTWVLVGVIGKIIFHHLVGLNYFLVTSWFNI